MIDAIGNEINVGDRVATDVARKSSSALRIGRITGVMDEHRGTMVKVTYQLQSRKYSYQERKYVDKMLTRGVWRYPEGVVKVVTNGIQA